MDEAPAAVAAWRLGLPAADHAARCVSIRSRGGAKIRVISRCQDAAGAVNFEILRKWLSPHREGFEQNIGLENDNDAR